MVRHSRTALVLFLAVLFPICNAGSSEDLAVASKYSQSALYPELYQKATPIVALTVEELRRLYPEDLGDLQFDDNPEELHFLLLKVGQNIEAFFGDFQNTTSRENVRQERLSERGKVENHMNQKFEYLIFVEAETKDLTARPDCVMRTSRIGATCV